VISNPKAYVIGVIGIGDAAKSSIDVDGNDIYIEYGHLIKKSLNVEYTVQDISLVIVILPFISTSVELTIPFSIHIGSTTSNTSIFKSL